MTTITQRATAFTDVRQHAITRGLLMFLFWIAAAVLVATFHIELESRSEAGSTIAGMASVAVVAYAYTRMCAPCAGTDHALSVGITWLLLAIIVEVTMTSRTGHGWYALIGTPAHPLLRNIFLFVWVFAPVALSRRNVEE